MDVPGARTLRPTNVACGFNTGPTPYVGPCLPSPLPGATPKPTFPKFQLHHERGFPWKYSSRGDTVTYFTWFLLYNVFFFLFIPDVTFPLREYRKVFNISKIFGIVGQSI